MTENREEFAAYFRQFLLELLIYMVLLTGYFLLVLRFLADPISALFKSNLPLYGFVALGLIAAQGVLLDILTSLLMRWLIKSEQQH